MIIRALFILCLSLSVALASQSRVSADGGQLGAWSMQVSVPDSSASRIDTALVAANDDPRSAAASVSLSNRMSISDPAATFTSTLVSSFSDGGGASEWVTFDRTANHNLGTPQECLSACTVATSDILLQGETEQWLLPAANGANAAAGALDVAPSQQSAAADVALFSVGTLLGLLPPTCQPQISPNDPQVQTTLAAFALQTGGEFTTPVKLVQSGRTDMAASVLAGELWYLRWEIAGLLESLPGGPVSFCSAAPAIRSAVELNSIGASLDVGLRAGDAGGRAAPALNTTLAHPKPPTVVAVSYKPAGARRTATAGATKTRASPTATATRTAPATPPTLTLNPKSGPPGALITATGGGWGAGTQVIASLDTPHPPGGAGATLAGADVATGCGPPACSGPGHADGNGNIAMRIQVPPGASPGAHTIYIARVCTSPGCGDTPIGAAFVVVAASTGTATPTLTPAPSRTSAPSQTPTR